MDAGNSFDNLEATAATTAEMKNPATFEQASWDLVNTWIAVSGQYPDLR